MKHVVGVGDMKLASKQGDVVITYSLGSCIGIAIYDPESLVGGILHFKLPLCRDTSGTEEKNVYAYADTGIPAFFKAAYSLGAEKKRLVVKAAGGATIMDQKDFFAIGKRNYVVMRKMFWRNEVFVDAEDVGGESWRTMSVDVSTGRVMIKNCEREYEL